MQKYFRRISSTLAVAILLMPIISVVVPQTASALTGDGSVENPFQIANCDDLRAMDDIDGQESSYFELTASFSCSSGGDFEPIGKDGNGWDYDPLMGGLDGNGFTISDVTINDSNNAGLFYGLYGAHVHDLTISNIVINGFTNAGSLAGFSTNNDERATNLENISVNGSINGGYSQVGGVVGSAVYTTVDNVVANVAITSGCYGVGGAFGSMQSSNIVNSSSTGDVTAESSECLNSSIGGFVGELSGEMDTTIDNSFATGNVTADSGIDSVGGFVGVSSCVASYSNSYSTGNVSGRDRVGGFVGQDGCMGNAAIYSQVYATGDVNGTDSVGGLVGNANITGIYQSRAEGNVIGSDNVGGLVGELVGSSLIDDRLVSQSYATGSVVGTYLVGGFIGRAAAGAILIDNYTRSSVTGDDYVGGFVGNIGDEETTITNSYSTGLVSQWGVYGGFFPGGVETGTINYSFWDTQTSGTEVSAGGAGKSTSQMNTQTTFTSELGANTWDFTSVWGIQADANDGYPCLLWSEDSCTMNLGSFDSDNIPPAEENAAPNDGDANNDGNLDSEQPNVTSFLNPISGKYVTIQTTCGEDTPSNSGVSAGAESTEHKDPGYNYPAGLANFTLNCSEAATITQFFYGDFDLNTITPRKYNSVTKTYTTITGATMTKEVIGGEKVLKIVYQIADNGPLDEDSTTGTIKDPSGPALLAVGVPNTGL